MSARVPKRSRNNGGTLTVPLDFRGRGPRRSVAPRRAKNADPTADRRTGRSSSRPEPGKSAFQEILSAGAPPFAMRDNDALAVPAQRPVSRGARRRPVGEGAPPIARRAGIGGGDPAEPRKRPAPPRPVLLQEPAVEGLDEIGDQRGARRVVKEDDLVHCERAPEPRLIEVRPPFRRRRILQGSRE